MTYTSRATDVFIRLLKRSSLFGNSWLRAGTEMYAFDVDQLSEYFALVDVGPDGLEWK